MGRWMEKARKSAAATPTKPPKPSFEGSVGMAHPDIQKKNASSKPLSSQQLCWLTAVAELLEAGAAHLIDEKFIDEHDLNEQLETEPAEVARLIRSNPRWGPP